MPFYQCRKCNKTWQYPINKCPNCFVGVVGLESKKIKVIAVSKVNIPSVSHPKIPYFVLLLEDEHGNKWAHKSVKEYDIGDNFVLGKAKGRDAVVIWRIKYDLENAVKKSLSFLNKIKIDKESKILILLTISTPKHPYLLENTSPELLDSIIQHLIDLNLQAKNIRVAGQSFNDFDLESILKKSKLMDVCQKHNIKYIDLAKTNFVEKKRNGLSVSLTEELFNKDLIINLPTIKLDTKLGIIGATENLIKTAEKTSFLKIQKTNRLNELSKIIQDFLPQTLTIAEADRIKKSNRFIAYLGLILASFNCLNLDRVVLDICMKNIVPDYLKDIDTAKIEVVGRQIDEVKYNIEAS
jgi:uncharacterized protein (DUF362 family)